MPGQNSRTGPGGVGVGDLVPRRAEELAQLLSAYCSGSAIRGNAGELALWVSMRESRRAYPLSKPLGPEPVLSWPTPTPRAWERAKHADPSRLQDPHDTNNNVISNKNLSIKGIAEGRDLESDQ